MNHTELAPPAREVLDFWFGEPGSPRFGEPRDEWFRKDEGFDAEIARRFGTGIEAALRGECAPWATTPLGALAEIVLLDQFTRNAFRGTPRAFEGDARALAAARRAIARGFDRGLNGVQRQFMILPFEHGEDLAVQQESLLLFEALAHEQPSRAGLVEWARRHHDIVARFGRFPHRNRVLGRASTPEEIEFLKQPGSSF